MKKLNNKGFTLVELLAVVVILAVVMGIAMTSVITAMNNSRKGSLEDSAISVANAFKTKYSESLVDGNASSIYVDETGVGYNFSSASSTSSKFYKLHQNLSDELNLSNDSYDLDEGTLSNKNANSLSILTGISTSFIAFDGERVVACLVAKDNGNYYVAGATKENATNATILSNNVTFDGSIMWACSNGEKSWEATEVTS